MHQRLQVSLPLSRLVTSRHDIKAISGANEGVIAKLRHHLKTDCLESSPCVAHSFALVGSDASLRVKRKRMIVFLSQDVNRSILHLLQATSLPFDSNRLPKLNQ